uniref:Uncharacterized protein n=1 Tax=Lynx canadensis TaxID=61383 RepID=A0A667HDE5_LYNCA
LIYVIRKYGTSYCKQIIRKKKSQLEEEKQAPIKYIQDVTDSEKSWQALVQKCHYLFVQRNNQRRQLPNVF